MNVTLFFDPSCPWTWRTSRWLLAVADARDLRISWRAFSLMLLAVLAGREPPADKREQRLAAHRALRMVEALRAAGRDGDVGAFYTAVGRRTHEAGLALSDDVTRDAAAAAGIEDTLPALHDPAWDAAVRASHEIAYESAGPDVGSPVLLLPAATRAVHGPILSAVPSGEDALLIWDCLLPLARTPEFLEVKRGRH